MKKILLILVTNSLFLLNSYANDFSQKQNNHEFSKVHISYAHDGCSFQFSPVDFCDDKHISIYKNSIKSLTPNFNQHYLLISIPEWNEYYQESIVAIDVQSGVVYPLPIDDYSGLPNKKDQITKKGDLKFSFNKNEVCITGAIFAYRTEEDGHFCFTFDGERFIGHRTPYMQ